MEAGGNGNNQWEWEGNANETRLNLGSAMGTGMNHWEWEGMGLKKTFPLNPSSHRPYSKKMEAPPLKEHMEFLC